MRSTVVTPPGLDFDRCYRAVSARDSRFDGQFYSVVRTTGIYCRPSCPAITPHAQNVDFVLTAAAAQQAGFRACRRCLPDAVPGSPRWNLRSDLASRAMRLIGDGVVDREGVEGLARLLGYSPRHLTRVLTENLGAGPLALARANRATNARILIECTSLPMADIAFAAGFASIRQFNDTIREVFAVHPSDLRTARRARGDVPAAVGPSPTVRLRLGARAPFSTGWLSWFLAGHAVDGIEHVDDDGYHRSMDLPGGPAVASMSLHDDHVAVQVTPTALTDLGAAVHRVRRLLDLDADVAAVEETLAADARIGPMVADFPGIRVPGATDPFETLMRTMLGQQISLAAARTHGGRLVAALGRPLDLPALAPSAPTPLTHLFPDAATIAEHGHTVLSGPRRRVQSIIDVARAVADGVVTLHAAMDADDMRATLLRLPGIGPWTADYVAMRVLSAPDVLLDTDLVLRRHAQAEGIDLTDGRRWSPWRSYVSMHLWRYALRRTDPQLAGREPPDVDPRPTPDRTVREEKP